MTDRRALQPDLKQQEREILTALGWRLLDNVVFKWKRPDGSYCNELPNLSDPSVFWPMFEAWCSAQEYSYRIDRRSRENYEFNINGALYPIEYGATQIEAGIRAWHAALTAHEGIKGEDASGDVK